MTEGYLQILLESLEKKKSVLLEIIDLEKEQLEIALKEELDFERYDDSVTKKDELIERLDKLDEGFTTTYEYVREELQENPKAHEEIVKELKKLVAEVTDLTVEVQSKEARNKEAIGLAIKKSRGRLKQKTVSKNAALQYYKNMSQINTVDPQLMDRKK